MTKPFVINVSAVKAFLRCRKRWYYEYVLGRVPKQGSVPLELGKLVHEAFEIHFNKVSMENAIKQVTDRYIQSVQTDNVDWKTELIIRVLEEFSALAEPLSHWVDKFPIEENLEVEETFEYPLDDFVVRGRPDRMSIIFGKLFHVQNRTLAAQTNLGLYSETAKRDLHELVYAWAMQRKYPNVPYGGTIMNIIKKLKYRGMPTKKHPQGRVLHTLDEMLVQTIVPILPRLIDQAINDLRYIVPQMKDTIKRLETGKAVASNRAADSGFFGNSRDPYFLALTNEVSIFDNEVFMDRIDPYLEARRYH